MSEDFLYYLWSYHFAGKLLKTVNGQQLLVKRPGQRNVDSGPDFFDCRIKIDDTLWAGNVEIHVKGSDWFRHGHQNDEGYNSIILHVVYENDESVFRKNGEQIPCLQLKGNFDECLYSKYQGFLLSTHWIPCASDISKIGYFTLLSWLERLAVERLEHKAETIQEQLKLAGGDFREIFYRNLLRSFGLKANRDAFEQLARTLPFSVLTKHKTDLLQLEALLFGQAGFLNKTYLEKYPNFLGKEYLFLSEKYGLQPMNASAWKFMRMRPSNFPTIRLSQFANLLFRSSGLIHKILTTENLSDVTGLLRSGTSKYWRNHYQFGKPQREQIKKMGISSIHLILINTIVPYTFVYGRFKNNLDLCEKAVRWLGEIHAENNTVIRHFEDLGVKARSAVHSQALIQLKTHYCEKKRCLNCAVGHELILKF